MGINAETDLRRDSSLRRYACGLWILTFLFFLRVLGQLLVVSFDVAFLPPMAAWYSGILPYPLLLPIQLVILVLQIMIGADFSRGNGFFVAVKPKMGRALRRFSYVYFAAMVLRYLISGRLVIPIVFHWVLAAYLFLLGHFHARQGPVQQG